MTFPSTTFIRDNSIEFKSSIINRLTSNKISENKLNQIKETVYEKAVSTAKSFVDSFKAEVNELEQSDMIQNISFFDNDEPEVDTNSEVKPQSKIKAKAFVIDNKALKNNILERIKTSQVSEINFSKIKSTKPVKTKTVANNFIQVLKQENTSFVDSNISQISNFISKKTDDLLIAKDKKQDVSLISIDLDKMAKKEDLDNIVNSLTKSTGKIDALSDMASLINRVSENKVLTMNDYSVLEKINKIVSQKLINGSNNLSSSEKASLKNFSTTFKKLEVLKTGLDKSIKIHNKQLSDTKSSSNDLLNELQKVEQKLVKKGLSLEKVDILRSKIKEAGVSMAEIEKFQSGKMDDINEVESFLGKFAAVGIDRKEIAVLQNSYQEILLAGMIQSKLESFADILDKTDPNNPSFGFTLYSTYMNKFTDALDSGLYNDDPQSLFKIMHEYDVIIEKIADIDSKSTSNELKQEQILSVIKKYISNPEEVENFSILLEKNYSANISFKEGADLVGGLTDAFSNDKKGLGLVYDSNKSHLDLAKKVNKDNFNFINKSPIIKSKLGRLANNISKTIKTGFQVNQNYRKYRKQSSKLAEIIKLASFKSPMTKEIRKQKIKLNDITSKGIEKIVNSFIKDANYLQSKLNLEIDPGTTHIISLLERFRDIIKELDFDTTENIKKEFESKIIDLNFMRNLKENRERLEAVDNYKEQIIESFKSSSEIKDNKLPLDLTLSENSAKFALISLYRTMIV